MKTATYAKEITNMAKLNQKLRDIACMRETIDHTGEIRIHLSYGRTGMVKSRMWHPDGFVMGSAGGGGYDKRGAALGEAIQLLFPTELKALVDDLEPNERLEVVRYPGGPQTTVRGLQVHHGKAYLDGACGYECMLDVLRALGFNQVDMFSTGKNSDMVLARKVAQ
jgi:hypothetical protein